MVFGDHSNRSVLIAFFFLLGVTMTKAMAPNSRGIMMILSPAKTLDLSPLTRQNLPPHTVPDCSPEQTKAIAQAMKERSESMLKSLLGISAALAKTSHGYWNQFDLESSQDTTTKPSIFFFSGAAYQGLDIESRSDSALRYLQGNLRIIDPLYGVLRPMDLMQPYRLEMATKKVLAEESIKLADYWKDSVTSFLAKELEAKEDPILLNLASDEYSAAVDGRKLPGKYVKIVFKDQGRVVSVHAKRARGLMCKYISENNVACLKDVEKFDEEGYAFVESESSNDVLVFNRASKLVTKRAAASASRQAKSKKVKD